MPIILVYNLKCARPTLNKLLINGSRSIGVSVK